MIGTCVNAPHTINWPGIYTRLVPHVDKLDDMKLAMASHDMCSKKILLATVWCPSDAGGMG